ncbi:unnamed protein product [Callosobruchus maculatus]|uniref:Uncharacterized protein n=1 Tax=Callosobruchus maculatus TaxID=64391 RepID=A0A653CMY7_CALMS|nr:unnamed protein product [Callosobruchus maculatus]
MRASTANLNDNHIEPPPHPGPSGIHASTDIWKAKPSDPSAQAGPSGVRASTPIWKDKSIAPPAQAALAEFGHRQLPRSTVAAVNETFQPETFQPTCEVYRTKLTNGRRWMNQ